MAWPNYIVLTRFLGCKSEDLVICGSEGSVVCKSCYLSFVHIDPSTGAVNEDIDHNQPFAYKLINHFRDWLAQCQGEESTDINPMILDLIVKKLKEKGITDIRRITAKIIRSVLQELKQSKFYEHSFQICFILTGKHPPRFSDEQKEELYRMYVISDSLGR